MFYGVFVFGRAVPLIQQTFTTFNPCLKLNSYTMTLIVNIPRWPTKKSALASIPNEWNLHNRVGLYSDTTQAIFSFSHILCKALASFSGSCQQELKAFFATIKLSPLLTHNNNILLHTHSIVPKKRVQ